MGLAAPRKRTKISHDPNNENWARSTSGFGHKIMSAQGWAPGRTLGAANAKHSDHYTSASWTHIRVSRKDDNLGLGARARRPLEDNEPTGLDAFQGLLGRLNGKSDAELQKDQRKREDRKLLSYVERRWKTMHFVSGGFLAQEKLERLEPATKPEVKEEKDSTDKDKKKDKKDKKDKKKKKDGKESKKGSKKRRDKESEDSKESDDTDSEETKRKKKSKKSKDKKSKKRNHGESESNDASENEDSKSSGSESSRSSPEAEQAPAAKPVPLPPRQLRGRHVLRGRHIQSKRMATLDDKSLNEIFMVKAKA